MATTTNVSLLKINYLSQAQYDNALANNQINADELYLTPSSVVSPGSSTTTGGLMSESDKTYLNSLSDSISSTSTTLTVKSGSSAGREIYLETYSNDTTDTALITAITNLGWNSDVIVT